MSSRKNNDGKETQPLLGSAINSDNGGPTGQQNVILPVAISLTAALAAVAFGYALGYTAPLHKIGTAPNVTQGTFPILGGGESVSDSTWSWFGSVINLGAMVGALVGAPCMDVLGRKGCIILSCVPMVVGFWMIFLASGSHGAIMLLGGRALSGIAVGLTSVSVPVYIAEIAPTHLRGGLGAVFQVGVVVGILYANLLCNIELSDPTKLYKTMAWIGTLLSSALFFFAMIMPRSPRWLVQKGRTQDAKNALRTLRGGNWDVDFEIDEIVRGKELAEAEGEASVKDLFSGPPGAAMAVSAGLMIFQQFSGINVVIFYVGTIFSMAGISNACVAAMMVAVVQVVVTVASCFIIDKAGRRSLLMVAGTGMAAMDIVLGVFFYEKDIKNSNPDGKAAITAVILYIAFFSIGLGAIPWLMMGELFPLKYRGTASSLATMLNWTLSFLVTETFKDLTDSALGTHGTFWLYSGVCCIGVLYVMTKVPETKGKTLEQIEDYFAGRDSGSSSDDNSGRGVVIVTAVISLAVAGVLIFLCLR
eukprot:m.744541 g.744541  ORF g.744541 m.744541 type:complete len:532 (-) comp23124_c0_seq20:376-1971(-)